MRQVTHALLTRPPLSQITLQSEEIRAKCFARLACVRHAPAFILSQDQTLVKSVCSVQESLLAILSLYCCLVPLRPLPSSKQSFSLRWLRQCSPALFLKNRFFRTTAVLAQSPLFEKFLFKEIFKGCCLLFSYQGSCRSFFSTALIFYQISFALSRTFLFFFSVLSAFLSVSFKRQLV